MVTWVIHCVTYLNQPLCLWRLLSHLKDIAPSIIRSITIRWTYPLHNFFKSKLNYDYKRCQNLGLIDHLFFYSQWTMKYWQGADWFVIWHPYWFWLSYTTSTDFLKQNYNGRNIVKMVTWIAPIPHIEVQRSLEWKMRLTMYLS